MSWCPYCPIRFSNAWLLCVPFFVGGIFIACQRNDTARRMSDMTGYSQTEKFFTILASLAPYPFIIATLWIPFTAMKPFLYIGLLVYLIGLTMFFGALRVISTTPPDKPFSDGPYRFSRNPLYVSAILIFLGICLATSNLILFIYLVFLSGLQHFMICAEERICKQRYGAYYEMYMEEVPRYLGAF